MIGGESDEIVIILSILIVSTALLNGIDDLLIDIVFTHYILKRKNDKKLRSGSDSHQALAEQTIAILVPVWHEAAVIGDMLINNIKSIQYSNYHIFVGLYPNDRETQKEVRRVIQNLKDMQEMDRKKRPEAQIEGCYPEVHMVIGLNRGPTSKADNLNQIYRYIEDYENSSSLKGDNDLKFSIMVLHDAEDVIHPEELKLFNELMTRQHYEFVQTPVFALPQAFWPERDDWSNMQNSFVSENEKDLFIRGRVSSMLMRVNHVSATILKKVHHYLVSAVYLEEFAEAHTKDLVSRWRIGGLVPSAGVGTGIARSALKKLLDDRSDGMLFNPYHLTEDYEIALKLHREGVSHCFWNQRGSGHAYIATREYFPQTLREAIWQKSRWVMGVVYQSMFPGIERSVAKDFLKSWQGDFATKYTLYRDRKMMLVGNINISSLILSLYLLSFMPLSDFIALGWSGKILHPAIMVLILLLLVERLVVKAISIRAVYGPDQVWGFIIRTLLMIGPLYSFLINLSANIVALIRYICHVLKIRRIKNQRLQQPADNLGEEQKQTIREMIPTWGKTKHRYYCAPEKVAESSGHRG